MSQVAISGNASGTGTLTIASPNTNSNYTLTLPTATTELVGTDTTQTLTNKTLTTPNINSAQVATVSGTAPIYFARAWVNFNGTGTVAILASGNVTSITDNGTGEYTVNITTAMPDANFVVSGSAHYLADNSNPPAALLLSRKTGSLQTTTTVAVQSWISGSNAIDCQRVEVVVFR